MNSVNKPVLTLSMDEKIYLAVAKKDLDKLSFVYTLACLMDKNKPGNYYINPTPEIHTFKDSKAAKIYHDTIDRIIEFQANDRAKEVLFTTNEKLIETFLENTR